MNQKIRSAVIGATGYVGQRFVSILADHPWFDLRFVAASERSAGLTYEQAATHRWKIDAEMPDMVKPYIVRTVEDLIGMADQIDCIFCAVDMPKAEIKVLEERLARAEIAVISNNSAHRNTADVPMMIPEINAEHSQLIDAQRKRLGTVFGFIACKPNCSIQSYVPALEPLRSFGIQKIMVTTYQAISGAGKTFSDWPEMQDNLIPYIGGEEEKSEAEPLKIWGEFDGDHIRPATLPVISAQCYRVAVQEGHTAAVSVEFEKKPSREEILSAWRGYVGEAKRRVLPSAPKSFLTYLEEDNRPQPLLDANRDHGMGISIGRLREDSIFDWKFTCLSHNTKRGAAGGAVLMAELLVSQGYLKSKT